MSFSITAAVSRFVSPRPLSVEDRIFTTNRLTAPVSTKEATQFIADTFNKGLPAGDVLRRLEAVLAKIGQSTFEAAKEAAKEQNPNINKYSQNSLAFLKEVKSDPTLLSLRKQAEPRQRIVDILEPKVLMYSKEYFHNCKQACGVSDSPSYSPRGYVLYSLEDVLTKIGQSTSDSPSSSPRSSVSEDSDSSSVRSTDSPDYNNPYFTKNSEDMARKYGWPIVDQK